MHAEEKVVPQVSTFDEVFSTEPGDFERGRYRRPLILQPDDSKAEYLSPSTVAKYAGTDEGLVRWRVAQAARTVARDRSAAAQIRGALVDSDVHRVLAGAVHDAAAAGTAFHSALETRDVPNDLADAVTNRDAALAAAGLVELPEYRERKVVDDDLRLAGTWDGIVRCPDPYRVEFPDGQEFDLSGRLVVLDDKTGRNALHWTQSGQPRGGNATAVQLTAYAHSRLYDVRTGVRTRLDALTPLVGLIVHTDLATAHTRLAWVRTDVRALRCCRYLAEWKPEMESAC